MLDHLRVVNLGVLEDAAIEPSAGFTVITGETGAGKTLLLGGLRLLLGGRADSRVVGPYAAEARVDGLFTSADEEVGASRIVPAEGRSRSYLEGSIISASALEARLGKMVEIVGQHDQLAIARPSHVLEMIDRSIEDGNIPTGYRDAWNRFQHALNRQRRLGGDRMELERELDLARYQAAEIAAAHLRPGLDEELEAAVSRLRNIEEIREHLGEGMDLTEGISEAIGEMVARMRKASGLDPTLADLASDAEGVAAAVAELARDVRTSEESLNVDPGRLSELEERLTAIGELKRKYGRTLDEVVSFGATTDARAGELQELLAEADEIDSVVTSARNEVERLAGELTAARQRAADDIARSVEAHLADLGLGSAQVDVVFEPADPGPRGMDRTILHFASDDRLERGAVDSVASGGELSRLVLASRLATRGDLASTLVFDEVDTGIGGTTALAMGRKLRELGDHGQIVCVTHLAQVAAHADTHYVVERDDSGVARVRRVVEEARITEITRMLAGQPESEAGQTAAAELLASATA